MWITPCKRNAARGMEIRPFSPNSDRSSTPDGVVGKREVFPPRAALRLHGVIHLIRLPAYAILIFETVL